MRISTTTVSWILAYIAYAFAVWVTAYHGLQGDDSLGLVAALLLFGGIAVIIIGLTIMGIKIPSKFPFIILAIGIIISFIWR